MRTKVTKNQLSQYLDAQPSCHETQRLISAMTSGLELHEENESFLLGLASGMVLLINTKQLSEPIKLMCEAVIEVCAIALRDREQSN